MFISSFWYGVMRGSVIEDVNNEYKRSRHSEHAFASNALRVMVGPETWWFSCSGSVAYDSWRSGRRDQGEA